MAIPSGSQQVDRDNGDGGDSNKTVEPLTTALLGLYWPTGVSISNLAGRRSSLRSASCLHFASSRQPGKGHLILYLVVGDQ